MTKPLTDLPKKIWFLWLQGYEDMPYLVQKCWWSWKQMHPDWELTFLHKDNIYDYIDIRSVLEDRESTIYPVSQSEIIRINLLRRYGGVWVDATCFCQQPLEKWLPEYLTSGFFAFHRPGKDRMLSSWFLAAHPNNALIEVYAQTVNDFWKNNKKIRMWVDRKWLHRILLKLKIHGYLKKYPTLWYHPIFVKLFKIYPYFWFFYLFEKLYHQNKTVQKTWDDTPKLSADIPHRIQHFGLFEKPDEAIRQYIDQRQDPLYKLTFKYDAAQYYSGCTLDYLLQTIDPVPSES